MLGLVFLVDLRGLEGLDKVEFFLNRGGFFGFVGGGGGVRIRAIAFEAFGKF